MQNNFCRFQNIIVPTPYLTKIGHVRVAKQTKSIKNLQFEKEVTFRR